MTIETPNLNDEIEVTPDNTRPSMTKRGTAVRTLGAVGRSSSACLVAVGSLGLYALKPWGPRLASSVQRGAGWRQRRWVRFQAAAEATMEGMLVDTQTYLALACSVMTGLCLAMAAMPLFNHRARLALFSEEE